MIRKVPPSLALLLLTVAISGFFMLVIARTDLVQSLCLKSIDGMIAIRAGVSPPSPALKDVVIVGVDDESFKRMNRAWPWGREVFAFFLEKLEAQKPKVVGFDFVFGGVSANPKADAWWAKTIADSGNVILASYIGPDGTLVLPHPQFAEPALALGLVDKPQDVDGIARKTKPFAMDSEEVRRYSLAEEAHYRFFGTSPGDRIREERGGVHFLPPAGEGAPKKGLDFAQTDAAGRIWLSYRYKPERFTYLSFWQVIKGAAPAGFFEDKIVLIGPVSPVFHDVHPTPLGEMPGIFVMANELIAARDGDFIREPFAGKKTLFAVVLGALFTLAIFQLAFAFQMVVFIALNLIFYGLCLFLFCRFGILIEPLSVLAVLALNFAAVASWKALKTFLDNIALQRQVITDSLTGLYGHRFLTLKLGSIFLHALQNKSEFCVAMLDADHFKKVNDTYGHDVGNQVLIGITKVMKQHVRRQDIAARFGGEEFAVVLIGTDTKGARECLERMRKAIEDLEFTSEKGKFKVTISSGLVSNQNPGVKNSEDMIKLADKALYEAKQQGRNRVCTA